MTNHIVAQPITIEAVDALKATLDAAIADHTAAVAASMARPNSLHAIRTVRAAFAAQVRAMDAWKAGEAALQAMWRAEDAQEDTAYETYLCERYDAMDNAIDYPASYDASMPIPYQITSLGATYLDHHYQTHSNAGMLTEGGDSPYADGTTGYVQPAPIPSYVHDGITDMDELTRLENLAY